jgi:hypothetical protein
MSQKSLTLHTVVIKNHNRLYFSGFGRQVSPSYVLRSNYKQSRVSQALLIQTIRINSSKTYSYCTKQQLPNQPFENNKKPNTND